MNNGFRVTELDGALVERDRPRRIDLEAEVAAAVARPAIDAVSMAWRFTRRWRRVDGVRTRAAYPNWQTAAALSFAAQCSSFASSSAADMGSHRQNGQRSWPRISS